MEIAISPPLAGGIAWILAASLVAALPMRRQFAPGFLLLLAAPVLVAWIGAVHGVLPAAFGVFAFLSMFRRPLRHLAGNLTGGESS